MTDPIGVSHASWFVKTLMPKLYTHMCPQFCIQELCVMAASYVGAPGDSTNSIGASCQACARVQGTACNPRDPINRSKDRGVIPGHDPWNHPAAQRPNRCCCFVHEPLIATLLPPFIHVTRLTVLKTACTKSPRNHTFLYART